MAPLSPDFCELLSSNVILSERELSEAKRARVEGPCAFLFRGRDQPVRQDNFSVEAPDFSPGNS